VQLKSLTEPLILALKDDDIIIQVAAIQALGEIKDPRAIKPLIDAFNEKKFQPVLADALHEITGQDFGENQAKWQKWWEENKN